MPTEQIAGVPINFDHVGHGQPTLIFVHGGACNLGDWDEQREALSRQFRIVRLDLPGHGQSGLPDVASVAGMAKAVTEIKLKYAQGPAVLIGHSLGCRVISEAYRQSPDDVIGIVYVDGSLFAQGNAERGIKAFNEKVESLGVEGFLQESFTAMFVSGSDPALRQRVVAAAKSWHPRVAQEATRSTIQWDAADAAGVLAGIRVPVLMLQSTYIDDQFQRRSLKPGMTTPWTELVARQIPGARLVVVPDVGHFAQIEAPDMVSREIGAFAVALRH
jgi:pimeloyl-ACP methyl ester carboxylesterase